MICSRFKGGLLMFSTRLCGIIAVSAGVLLACSTARATLTTFTDRATFLANLPGVGESESFEDESTDVQAGPRMITTSTSDVVFTGSPDATFGVSDVVAGGRGPTDGSHYLQVGFIGTSSVRFVFPQPLLAFGIDVVDKNVNDLDGTIDDLTQNGSVDPAGEGVVQFWGVIASADMAFTKVGFAGQGPSVPGDTFALDNIVFSSAVPSPSSLTLFVCAAISCQAVLRYRR